MSDRGSLENLKQEIVENIYTNENQAVTGDLLQDVLIDAVDTMGVSVSQNTNTKGQQLYIGNEKIGNIDDVFNVNSFNNKGDAYTDTQAAKSAVPISIRALGLIIAYLLDDGWHIEQFIGGSLDSWFSEFSWFEILYNQKLFAFTKDDTDFLIGDEQGNVIAEVSKGEMKTKKFDSALAPQSAMSNTADDFLIGDEQGNVILQVKKGKININGFAERPESGIENFKVSVNYKNTFNTIGEDVDEVEDNTNYVYQDDCVVGLPTNYSPTGEPIRLIIHCGGTGERINSTTNPITSDYHGWNYFLFKGFAVLDCNGIADDYISNIRGGGSRNHFGCKYLLQSYKKAYDYVTKKYNIAKDGCFVTGISMGGLASFMIVQSGMFPVLAQGGFCPCIDIFKQSFLNPWSDQATKTPIDYGFDAKQESETNTEWFVRNIDKVIGWNSLEKNTIGDKTNLWTYFSGNDEANVYEGLNKVYPCPLKIWHCKNDTTVVYRYSEYCVKMIRNAGGTAELHSFTTGGHAGGWSYSTINDNGFTTSINFYEAILFFNRFINK